MEDPEETGELLEGVNEKTLTASQKKNLKKKLKEKAEKDKKAAEKAADDGNGDDKAEEASAPAAAKKGAKGKPVKENAMAKKIREQLEARRLAEEEQRRKEEELRRKEEEEMRRLEEEEKRKAEERARKLEDRKNRREQLRREGKLLTGKAKEEAEKRAAIAQQLLAKAAEQGIDLSVDSAEVGEKKKTVIGRRKNNRRKVDDDEKQDQEELAKKQAEEEAARKAEEEKAAEAAAAEAAVATQVESDNWDDKGSDDWENIVVEETKDKKTEAQPKVNAAKKDAGSDENEDEDEEDEEEDSESGADEDEDGQESGDEEDDKSANQAKKGDSSEKAVKKESVAKAEDDDSEDEDEESSEDEDEESSEEDEDEDEDDEEARERRIEEARERRLSRYAAAKKLASKDELRSPICCILGHVDVGKTKILDNIRRTNVGEGEAGGITQQIGATFIPADAIANRTVDLRAGKGYDLRLPGLLVIDTPGHESFTNLRQRGSGLCDIAVLVVDLMHGLEQQTIESINLLRMRKTPFIIALNKVDRLYGWKSNEKLPIREAFKRQKEFVNTEFEKRSSQVFLQLNEQGLNVELYWKNKDLRSYVSVVPTSAVTGEGISDLLHVIVKLTQTMLADRLMYVDVPQCSVLEVKTMEGLGTTVDVVLLNGKLREGDRIVVCGLGGPLVTRIKALKTPQALRELRIKGQLMDHKEIKAAMGVKIVAPGLETAVAGTSMFVITPDDSEEELKDAVMEDMTDIFSKVDKGGEGVCVQASTLGSLEALLTFLDSEAVNIPVSGINIGPVHKRDVLKANVMNERKMSKFAVILAFDVPVAKEARELAEELKVKVFTADVIYHLFDQFTAYMAQCKSSEQEANRLLAVFPCQLRILPTCIFQRKDPIVLGVDVVEGVARIGTPLVAQTEAGLVDLGRIAGIEVDHKATDNVRVGKSFAMKIEGTNADEKQRLYGRHFDHTHSLVSRISRESIDAVKASFADEMTKDDWRLVVKLKKTFQVV
eukprot:CAMPEP_0175050096 /NCGR_PEP_ID=MMETSP0052_2-20121109/7081_1 /TAXON_ID=51329 ORGANISM="Polytomella parva, Strain SAG 63-3" /NCGR_SAMPLE_ID=MMETSP0052_2 /ASSEMBLY_ACC=CAM_ASM_000194 /LENGTH=1000 /DNA_ID=CAMNT_0016314285 /DNA_START=35 /DNA_END=3037 /DNA_ORIENTATION=+